MHTMYDVHGDVLVCRACVLLDSRQFVRYVGHRNDEWVPAACVFSTHGCRYSDKKTYTRARARVFNEAQLQGNITETSRYWLKLR